MKYLKEGCQWFMPAILPTKEGEIRRIMVQSQPRQKFETISKNTHHKKGLAEWLKQ
jgi:hypothetical protein